MAEVIEWWDVAERNERRYRHRGCDEGDAPWVVPLDDCPPPARAEEECARCARILPLVERQVDALAVLTRLVAEVRSGSGGKTQARALRDGEALLRQLQQGSREALDRVTLLQRLERFTDGEDAEVSIGRRGYGRGGDWVVMVNYGHEAEDSPMVGAQALGLGDTLEAALQQALGEAKR